MVVQVNLSLNLSSSRRTKECSPPCCGRIPNSEKKAPKGGKAGKPGAKSRSRSPGHLAKGSSTEAAKEADKAAKEADKAATAA